MKTLHNRELLSSVLVLFLFTVSAIAAPAPKWNVLHIVSDDLCARLGAYGDPQVKSPNIDRLAKRGVKFDRAYCQFPLCNPSRASFMTGLRPDTLHVYENATQFRKNVADAVSLPQSFQKAGYSVMRIGKLYHYGVPAQIGTDGMDDPESWEKVINPKGRDVDDFTMIDRIVSAGTPPKTVTEKASALNQLGATLSWLPAEGKDSEQTDGLSAVAAIQQLEAAKKSGKPFYLAVGFFRPHTPYVAPKKYFDLYPTDKIVLPVVPVNLATMFPAPALSVQRKVEVEMSDELKRKAIQAYLASISFMDACVGELLEALDRLNLADNTIIVFHSDHGYHLGEKNLWQKMSIFEESAKVPLVIFVPGNKANGTACGRPVELVDLHKTLTDLCGIPAGAKTEGNSLKPLVENPKAEWKHAAYSQVTRGIAVGTFDGGKKKGNKQIMGRSVRTERWRYTEWNEGESGAELYDHDTDPREMKNLAKDPSHARTVAEMKTLLAAPKN